MTSLAGDGPPPAPRLRHGEETIVDMTNGLGEPVSRSHQLDRAEETPVPPHSNPARFYRERLGALAGILSLAMNADKPLDERDVSMDVVKLVAGARNRRNLPAEIFTMFSEASVRPFDAAA